MTSGQASRKPQATNRPFPALRVPKRTIGFHPGLSSTYHFQHVRNHPVAEIYSCRPLSASDREPPKSLRAITAIH